MEKLKKKKRSHRVPDLHVLLGRSQELPRGIPTLGGIFGTWTPQTRSLVCRGKSCFFPLLPLNYTFLSGFPPPPPQGWSYGALAQDMESLLLKPLGNEFVHNMVSHHQSCWCLSRIRSLRYHKIYKTECIF